MRNRNLKKNVIYLVFLTIFIISCEKKKMDKYKCDANCVNLTIKLNLVDSSKILDKSYLKNASYNIVFYKQTSGLFSQPEEYFIKSGKLDNLGGLLETIEVNKEKLNNIDYWVQVRYKLDNSITMCLNPKIYEVLDFPNNGTIIDIIPVRKNISKTINLVRTDIDTFESGKFYIDSDCEGTYIDINSTPTNTIKKIDAKFPINSLAFFRVRKFQKTGGYIDKVDSVFIDENFNGKTMEY